MKKKNEDYEEINKKDIKVICKNTYIGKLGNYYKGNIYKLSYDKYKILENDFTETK